MVIHVSAANSVYVPCKSFYGNLTHLSWFEFSRVSPIAECQEYFTRSDMIFWYKTSFNIYETVYKSLLDEMENFEASVLTQHERKEKF